MADMRLLRELSVRWAESYAAVYRVPIELVEAIIDVESGWNPHAVSSKGAVGLMQLMPGTAVRFGVHNRFRVDENIHGGVAYLAWLNKKFNGDFRLITAAYHVGEFPISRRGLDYSSPDVRRYVQRVCQRFRARRIARSGDTAKAGSEAGNEKSSSFRLVVPGDSACSCQCSGNDDHSAGSLHINCRSPDHDD